MDYCRAIKMQTTALSGRNLVRAGQAATPRDMTPKMRDSTMAAVHGITKRCLALTENRLNP